jgi:hypothetical protein
MTLTAGADKHGGGQCSLDKAFGYMQPPQKKYHSHNLSHQQPRGHRQMQTIPPASGDRLSITPSENHGWGSSLQATRLDKHPRDNVWVDVTCRTTVLKVAFSFVGSVVANAA